MAGKGVKLIIPRAYQVIQHGLEEAILSGDIETGEALPTETYLADRYGVTRHTVREAMRALEQSGLVTRGAGRRLHAARPSYDTLAPTTSRALLMQGVTFRELWEVAMQIEVFAIDLAVNRINPLLIERLTENLKQMEVALKKGKSIVNLDVEFHSIIAEGAGNRVLQLSREPVSQLFYPSLEKLFAQPKTKKIGPRRLVDAHRYIIDAIKAGDAQLAHEWMRKHMADFLRGYEFAGLDVNAPSDTKPTANFQFSYSEAVGG